MWDDSDPQTLIWVKKGFRPRRMLIANGGIARARRALCYRGRRVASLNNTMSGATIYRTSLMKPLACETTLALCALEPPEPMERVLTALRTLSDGSYLRMIIDREPLPLYALLTRGGFDYETHGSSAGRYEIDIWRTR